MNNLLFFEDETALTVEAINNDKRGQSLDVPRGRANILSVKHILIPLGITSQGEVLISPYVIILADTEGGQNALFKLR